MDRREGLGLLKRVAGAVTVDQWNYMHAVLSESGGEHRFQGHPTFERLQEILAAHERDSGVTGRVGAHDRRLSFDALFPNAAAVRVL